MNVPYALIAPALLTAATVTYIVTGSGPHVPREAAAEPAATLSETATSTAADSATPLPTREPTSTPMPDLPDALPDGLSGSLTYRTGHELVTVAFPSMDASRRPDPGVTPGDVSADGLGGSKHRPAQGARAATSSSLRPTARNTRRSC